MPGPVAIISISEISPTISKYILLHCTGVKLLMITGRSVRPPASLKHDQRQCISRGRRDALAGETAENDAVRVPLDLEPHESKFIVIGREI
jgi:hypothetical protein